MGNRTRPFNGAPVRLVLAFAKASVVLESAVVALLREGWDEDCRRLVHHMAGALRRAAGQARWWDRERTLRALESLLALSSAELLPHRKPIGDKILELMADLMTAPACRSA